MNVQEIGELFDYSYWATGRLLDAAAGLADGQLDAPFAGLSHGTIRRTLVHMLAAEAIWRARCLEGVSPTALLAEADFPTLDALRARWTEEERLMRAGLARLTDEALAGPINYRTTKGVPQSDTLWELLVHLINHGTQHRSEASVALTAFGCSPGDLDFIIYLRR